MSDNTEEAKKFEEAAKKSNSKVDLLFAALYHFLDNDDEAGEKCRRAAQVHEVAAKIEDAKK